MYQLYETNQSITGYVKTIDKQHGPTQKCVDPVIYETFCKSDQKRLDELAIKVGQQNNNAENNSEKK